MKSILQDNHATGNMSYIIPVILLSVLLSGGLSNLFTVGVNEVLSIHNMNVDEGRATLQTENNLNFAKNIFNALGIITILGALLWGKIHSTTENTFVDAGILIGGMVAMYVMTFFSMLLILSFGMSLDIALPVFDTIANSINISGTSWATTVDSYEGTHISLVYMLCQIPLLLGVITYFVAAIQKTTGVTFDASEYQNVEVE